MSVFGPIQFCKGDQGPLKWKFKESYMKICPVCNKIRLNREQFTEGCRFNGDGYGTVVFTCEDCNWKTSFLYDEASEDYFYEKPPSTKTGHILGSK